MVFLRPKAHRIHDIFAVHPPLTGCVVAAGRAVRPAPVLILPVKIIGDCPLETAVRIISMVKYHIHDDPYARPVQRLYHFPALLYTHRTVKRIRGIGTFRHIIIDRVIPPVELSVLSRFVHRTVIVHRQYLDVRHPQPLQPFHTRRFFRIAVQPGIFTGKRLVFSAVSLRDAAPFVIGKILHMDFPYHGSCAARPVPARFLPQFFVERRPLAFPSLRRSFL